ncbi:MAG: hypothetical protein KKG84_01475 [Candidatus Omnitrophica bacterium]|nr:hypothetical protein [Candidatus Omnitrophota bacterium]
MLKIFRTLIGLLILPVAIGTAKAFGSAISDISFLNGVLHLLERGVLIYVLFHVLVLRPVYIYVLAHEFVHVIATWICGGKIVSFNVRPSGGNVVTSKTNLFIELSPYFVPLYTIIVGMIFAVIRATGKGPVFMSEILLFLIGITLALHLVMTAEALRVQQPDIMKSGIIFSYALIFIGNLVVVIGVFSIIFADVNFMDFIRNAYSSSMEIYRAVYAKILILRANYIS